MIFFFCSNKNLNSLPYISINIVENKSLHILYKTLSQRKAILSFLKVRIENKLYLHFIDIFIQILIILINEIIKQFFAGSFLVM